MQSVISSMKMQLRIQLEASVEQIMINICCLIIYLAQFQSSRHTSVPIYFLLAHSNVIAQVARDKLTQIYL